MATSFRRAPVKERIVRRIPGVSALAALFARIAAKRHGRVPSGLLLLLPLALLLDAYDVVDELALGPIGMAVSFLVESAFVLGVTGRMGYAFAFAGIDLIPGVDLIPFATITLLVEIVKGWKAPLASAMPPSGPVLDV